jgi:hypothetical protein
VHQQVQVQMTCPLLLLHLMLAPWHLLLLLLLQQAAVQI